MKKLLMIVAIMTSVMVSSIVLAGIAETGIVRVSKWTTTFQTSACTGDSIPTGLSTGRTRHCTVSSNLPMTYIDSTYADMHTENVSSELAYNNWIFWDVTDDEWDRSCDFGDLQYYENTTGIYYYAGYEDNEIDDVNFPACGTPSIMKVRFQFDNESIEHTFYFDYPYQGICVE